MGPNGAIEQTATSVLDRHQCDLVQVTFRREQSGWVLRVLLERRGSDPQKGAGVDHKLCATVSRDLSAVLDAEEVIECDYTLEVSSPGVRRPLVRDGDFTRFVGREAEIKTKAVLGGRRRFRGVLKGMADRAVLVQTADGETTAIPSELIEQANLVFEPKGPGKWQGVG